MVVGLYVVTHTEDDRCIAASGRDIRHMLDRLHRLFDFCLLRLFSAFVYIHLFERIEFSYSGNDASLSGVFFLSSGTYRHYDHSTRPP